MSLLPAGQPSIITSNTYDADGRLLQVQQSAGGSVLRTTSSTYTPSGKVATATDPAGNVTRFAYDLLDRQTTVTDAMGRVAQLTYNTLGRPWRTYNTAIQAGPLVQRTYTADGQLAALADANGNTTSFAYDSFGRLGDDLSAGQHRDLHLQRPRQPAEPQDPRRRHHRLRLQHARPAGQQDAALRAGGDLQLRSQ